MEPLRIVGIGASAGGLESLEQLFSALPSDTGMAFIVVQHLSPDFKSLMDELIARYSDMPVANATDGMRVEANHIYLMPSRKEMIIREGTLRLTEKDPNTFSLPIDQFLRSLAQDAKEKAVAVILSGSGSDGSRGIVDVKNAGGLVMVESSASAKFDGMPLSAEETGTVAHINTPKDLARILCGLAPVDAPTALEQQLDDNPVVDQILRRLRDSSGLDFSLYKTSTVTRRLQRRIDLLGLENLDQYLDRVRGDDDELDALFQDLLIGVTQFFRDPDAFAVLEREVIPQILDRVGSDQEVRIWVAGCATGEEAYSLAILLHEAMTSRDRPVNVKIIATDIHQQSLDHASAGVYGESQLANVSSARLERFFTRRASGYQISADLRSLIVFARHNVTRDAPFTRMHLITCRNLLIYLQPPAQRTVLSLFHFGLVTNGVMFLGPSETPGALADELTSINEHWKVYAKRRDVTLLGHLGLPVHRTASRRAVTYDPGRIQGPDPMVLATYDQLLDRFMPPGFLVDEDRTLLDSFAGAERFLKMKKRRPSGNLLDLLDDDVRGVVASGIQRAIKDKAPVSYSGVKMRTEEGEARATMTAEPLLHPRTGARTVLVTFQQMTDAEPSLSNPQMITATEASREHLASLEAELMYTRENLQATIEELETSNEETQATNEELVASNEELQSTNEELHSVNEELYTVNAEYQHKILELKELNADMAHLLEGTDVGTVFLDRELRIRRFTTRIASIFRFKQHDVGRKIGDFSHNIERPQLMADIQRVREQGVTVEDEVRDHDGVPYYLRILPYRMTQRAERAGDVTPIDGVVLTLTDMTAVDKARSRLAQLSAIVESSDDAIVGKGLDGTITSWNKGAERLYGYSADEIVGHNVSELMPPGAENELQDFLKRIARGEKVEHAQSVRMRKDGSRIDVSVTLSPIFDVSKKLIGVSAIARDISPLAAAHRELKERAEENNRLLAQSEEAADRREQFIAMLSHELRNPLAAVTSAVGLLRMSPAPSVIDRAQVALDRQTKHMKRLLDDLLDVSRITRGKFDLRLTDLDLRQPLDGAIEATAPLLKERGVMLDLAIPNTRLPVNGDSNRLLQVFVNLLSNAANYSPQGSKVHLTVELEGNGILVTVKDHGVGIEASLLGQIFELFVQSPQRLDRSRGGLGVGLSLAKSIVERHNGKIEAHSEGVGKGATFTIALPRHAVATTEDQERRHRGERCRIVLVDDQEDSREMLRMLLESRDHTVHDAADGEAALELIARVVPDVAFIDIGLPVMDGYQVAQQIRKRDDLAGVKLVALTGYGAPSDVSAALAAGFDEHVIKPADISRLEQVLARRAET